MTDLYVKCERCGGTRHNMAATSLTEQLQDCLACSGVGFVPYELPMPSADMEALAREIISWAVNTSRQQDWRGQLLAHWLDKTSPIQAAKIAAFCKKREADLRAENERLRVALTECMTVESRSVFHIAQAALKGAEKG